MTEYVTNGTFDTDIIGWTDNSTGSATIEWSADNGGSLLLTGAGESVQAIADQQVAATTAGTRYKLTFDVYSISGGFADVDVGTSVGDDSLSENHITSSGSYEDEFTAIGATTWIRIDAEGEGNTVYIDNVSIQEAFSGGYWQSSIGVARLSDPTLQMGDVAYRELIRAKANANNVDPLLANIYTYIVDAHEQITHCTLSDPSTAPLLKDGDMEASGFDDWVQGGSPTLTKETTDPVEGTQYAKIAYNGTIEPYIRQAVLTVGHTYRIRGAARANGCTAVLLIGGVSAWSTASSTWVEFDVTATAAQTSIWLYSSGCNAGGDYHEWDNVTVERVFSDSVELGVNDLIVDVGINDDELMYQGERHRLYAHGPRSGGVDLHIANWTYEYLPFTRYLNIISRWSINDTTIDSQPSKILTCDTADYCWLPRTHFVDLSAASAAYGTWEFWLYHASGNTSKIMPVASVAELPTHASQDGYLIEVDTNGAVLLREVSSGVATTFFKSIDATVADDTWAKITMTRNASDEFTVYVNDVACSGGELLADGDMEAVGVGSWTAGSGATLTKEGSAHGGAQCLRVTDAGSTAYAGQLMTGVGNMTVSGWARSDGTSSPYFRDGATILWVGTTSTSWQNFSVAKTSSAGFWAQFWKDGFGNYVEWDDCSIVYAHGFAEATTTTSDFMVLDLDAGDRVALEKFEDDIKLFTYTPL